MCSGVRLCPIAARAAGTNVAPGNRRISEPAANGRARRVPVVASIECRGELPRGLASRIIRERMGNVVRVFLVQTLQRQGGKPRGGRLIEGTYDPAVPRSSALPIGERAARAV